MQISDILKSFSSLNILEQQRHIAHIRVSRFTPKQTSKKPKKASAPKKTKTEKLVAKVEDMSTEELEKLLEGLE